MHVTLIKKRGEGPVLFHGDMERDEAAKSGLKCIPYSKYDYDALLKKADNSMLLANALRCELMFRDLGITSGQVGVYGTYDLSATFGILTHLQNLLPDIEFIGESSSDSVIVRAMETKDESEVARIRRMGEITTSVVGMVRDYLIACDVRNDEVLLKDDGSPLTVGDVGIRVQLLLRSLSEEDVQSGGFTAEEMELYLFYLKRVVERNEKMLAKGR